MVLEGARGVERGDFGEAAAGVEGAGFDEVVARVEEEVGQALGAGGGFGGGEEGAATSTAAELREDEEAGQLARGVEAEVARGDAVGAQDEEGSEADGGEFRRA